jgi:hypothetical protein
MTRKSTTVTPEQRIERLEAENAELKQKVRTFTPSEWAAKEADRRIERQRNDKRNQAAEEGLSWAQANNYPDLQGSVKQVRWAQTIRHTLVEKFRKEQPGVAAEVEDSLREKKLAVWWISRSPRSGQETATELLSRHTINENIWSGERTACPGVVIPGTARDTPSWVN